MVLFFSTILLRYHTVDDIRTLNYGNYGIFLIMGTAGFISINPNTP